MGSMSGHKINHNRAEALGSQRHIASKKLTQVLTPPGILTSVFKPFLNWINHYLFDHTIPHKNTSPIVFTLCHFFYFISQTINVPFVLSLFHFNALYCWWWRRSTIKRDITNNNFSDVFTVVVRLFWMSTVTSKCIMGWLTHSFTVIQS